MFKHTVQRPEINETIRPVPSDGINQVPLFTQLWQTFKTTEEQKAACERHYAQKEQATVVEISKNLFDLKRILKFAAADQKDQPVEQIMMKRLNMVADNLEASIMGMGYEIIVFDGKKWSDVDPDTAELHEFIEVADMPEIIVIETLSPLIKGPEGIVQTASVIVSGSRGKQ